MGLNTIIGNFVKGLGSAVTYVGTIKQALSCAIADGVDGGIKRAMPILMKNVALGAVILTGIFLFGFGVAKWAESLIATPGHGFILTGIVLVAAAGIYLTIDSRGVEK